MARIFGWGELLSACSTAAALVSSSPGLSLPPSPALPFISFGGESAPPPSSIPGNRSNPSRAAEPIKPHRQSHKFQGHCCFWFQGQKWWVCPGHVGGLLAHSSPVCKRSSPCPTLTPWIDLPGLGRWESCSACCCVSSKLCSPALGFLTLK